MSSVPKAVAPGRTGAKTECWGPLVDRRKKLFLAWSYRAGYQLAISMFAELQNRTHQLSDYTEQFKAGHNDAIMQAVAKQSPVIANHNSVEAAYDQFRLEILGAAGHCATRADWMAPDLFKFKVVRNPFARAVSTYLNMLITGLGQKPRLQGTLADHLKLGVRSDFTAVSFVRFLRAMQTLGLDTFDAQATPQIKQFEQSRFKYDLVCKVEEIEQCVAKLNARANCSMGSIVLERVKTAALAKADVATLPFGQIRVGAMPPVPHFYSGHDGMEAMQIVRGLYHADFAAYDYSTKEIPDDLSLFLNFRGADGGRPDAPLRLYSMY